MSDILAKEIDARNIQRLLEQFSALSEGGNGVTRLGYTPLERKAHDIFRSFMEDLGAEVTVDTAGNTIAELKPETASNLSALGTGSHLDSVPQGGSFDGIAGVVAGMELARSLVASKTALHRPWRFVVFANEEGARFGQACNGSRAVAGLSTVSGLKGLHDNAGITLYDAMKDVGLDPDRLEDSRWNPEDWHAFIELHIEQGNQLEQRALPIGIVDSISGSTRMKVRFKGTASHTGGTPMHHRRDALAGAAECVLFGEKLANSQSHHGNRITVGYLQVHPNSTTTIPGEVEFNVDIRDFDTLRQRDTAAILIEEFSAIAERRNLDITLEKIGDTSPVMLSGRVASAIEKASKSLAKKYYVMSSGASHDSQQVAHIVDTGMIFVPSKDGLSHVPEEWTDYDQIAEGTRVLAAALLQLQ
ncbi:MAG: M20 family metallo-hydrolase [Microbacteriaceae bacterium]